METAMQKLENKLKNQLSFSKVSDIQSILDYINEEGKPNEKEQLLKEYQRGMNDEFNIILNIAKPKKQILNQNK